MRTAGFISLGCPKNQVDAEIMLAALERDGFEITDPYQGCDVVIINTCGFIEAAQKEAIENILDIAQLKADGLVKAIVVTGCLAERFREQIKSEIPEVDAVLGIGANADIAENCRRAIDGEQFELYPPKENLPLCGERLLTTPEHWAYLKIAEGCSNRCSYCAIPSIRGGFRSRSAQEIIEEATQLAANGVKELILVAQDTTLYGKDLYGELYLPKLLTELCRIDGIHWIRLLYCYPDKVTDELLTVMANEPKILHYMDLPLQHASNKILKAMNRHGTREEISSLIDKMRETIPDIVIRTTMIVGFPGETEEDFEELAEFVNETEFERLGCFTYSAEDGTPAAAFDEQIDEETKNRRGEIIMNDQYEINACKNREIIGRQLEVVVEEYDAYSDSYSGRSYMDAPEIDGCVKFASGRELAIGEFVTVKIFDADEDDQFTLLGEVTE